MEDKFKHAPPETNREMQERQLREREENLDAKHKREQGSIFHISGKDYILVKSNRHDGYELRNIDLYTGEIKDAVYTSF